MLFFALFVLLRISTGVRVESSYLQMGLKEIANRALARAKPVNLGSQAVDAPLKKLSNVEVSAVNIGDMTISADFGDSTKTVSGIALDYVYVDLANVSMNVTGLLETTSSTSSVRVSANTKQSSTLSLKIVSPDRVGAFGHTGCQCEANIKLGSVNGLTKEMKSAEKEVQKALEARVAKVICFGGAPDANLYHDIGKTGIEGFLNKTANRLIDTVMNRRLGLKPDSAAARAAALTNFTNNIAIPQFLHQIHIANRNFAAGFGMKDVHIEKVHVGEIQFFQTLLDPMMPEVANWKNKIKAFAKGITASAKFTLVTPFGDAPAYLTVKPSSVDIGVTFSRDKDNFAVDPKPGCKVNMDLNLDVPSQSWDPIWWAFLAGIDPMMDNAISGAVCGGVKTIITGVFAKQYDAPAAGVWHNIVEHKDAKVYAINDTVFPWTKNWAAPFENSAVAAKTDENLGLSFLEYMTGF